MRNTLQDFRRYLRDTLSIWTTPEDWEDADRLPFYLRDLYTFCKVNILSVGYLLMVDRGQADTTPMNIRKHLVQVQDKWEGEIVYLRDAVSAYNRKRLIENRIPFVVPGNQMYLPMIGIDLREHFRRTTSAPHAFSPSTQAMLLYTLLKGDQEAYNPSMLASRLGYSPMTMTRAFGELEAAELGEITIIGRERVLRLGKNKGTIWDAAQSFLSSPVAKRQWITRPQTEWPGLLAGITALSRYSMLAPPATPVYAVSREEWRAMRQREAARIAESGGRSEQIQFRVSPQERDVLRQHAKQRGVSVAEYVRQELVYKEEPGLCELEIWSYSPRLLSETDVVDRLSLFLSLPKPQDERVESALEKMMGELEW